LAGGKAKRAFVVDSLGQGTCPGLYVGSRKGGILENPLATDRAIRDTFIFIKEVVELLLSGQYTSIF